MKKVITSILIFILAITAFVFPSTMKTVDAAATVTYYAMAENTGTALASGSISNPWSVSYQDLMNDIQANLASSYVDQNTGVTYYADFSKLYSDSSLTTVLPESSISSTRSVYVRYYSGKTITIYQRTFSGISIGSYTVEVLHDYDLLSLVARSELPTYNFARFCLDSNDSTLLAYDNCSTAYNNGYLYAFYSLQAYVAYYYATDSNQPTFIYNRYVGVDSTAPDSSVISSAIPSGYRIESWHTGFPCTDANKISEFPYADGSTYAYDFFAFLVPDEPQFSVFVYVSLSNSVSEFYNSYYFDENEQITLTVPTVRGYEFVSWHTSFPCTSENRIYNFPLASSNEAYYALMNRTTVDVTLYWVDSLQGTPYEKTTLTIPYNTSPNLSPYLIRDGYALVKVTSDYSGLYAVSSFGPLTSDVLWYAWFSTTVDVNYYQKLSNSTSSTLITTITVAVGTRAPTISIPEIEGYSFVGYSTDLLGAITFDLPVITSQTNIYLNYAYSVGEDDSVYLYKMTFRIDGPWVVESNPFTHETFVGDVINVQPSFMSMAFGIKVNNNVTFVDLPKSYSSYDIKHAVQSTEGTFSTYKFYATYDYENQVYSFKLLSFAPIDFNASGNGFLMRFDCVVKLYNTNNDNIGTLPLTFDVPLGVTNISKPNMVHLEVDQIRLENNLFYLFDKPSTIPPTETSMVKVFGSFFDSVGNFLFRILSYRLFDTIPLYTLIAVPLALGVLLWLIKSVRG